MAQRTVVPEWLDELPPEDPRAIGSRRDLRRLNICMGNARVIRNVLADFSRAASPLRLAELGAGDGTFFLRVAGLLGSLGRGAKVLLVDRRPSLSSQTHAAILELGWTVEVVAADIFDWLPAPNSIDVMTANLFLHHFETDELARLLRLISQHSRLLVACEPRRCATALAISNVLWGIGCNAVTRHDAPISVRAGFRGTDLSTAWPDPRWQLREQRSGLFSHLFVARKTAA